MPVKTNRPYPAIRHCYLAAAGLCLLLLSPVSFATEHRLPPGLLQLQPRPAPALRLANMDGKVTDLRKLRGHWVMVHFWASWCGPCRREMPTIQAMATKMAPRYLRLVLVNTAERDDDVFAFLGGVAPDLDSLMDRDGSVTARWQPRGLPSTYLVDPQGRERYLALGGRRWNSKAYLEFLSHLSD
jgi:cytochrome c biogenesis protein CcmG/thiol:disulfide interchange protein DsbE